MTKDLDTLFSGAMKAAGGGRKCKPATALNRLNESLSALITNRYFEHVPLADMLRMAEEEGFSLDEENTPFALLGHEGKADIELRMSGAKKSAWLHLTWYRMPSGRFEVVAYAN